MGAAMHAAPHQDTPMRFTFALCLLLATLAACGTQDRTATDHAAVANPNAPAAQDANVAQPAQDSNVVAEPNAPFAPTTSEPMQPGTYQVSLALDTDEGNTTCNVAACPSDGDGSFTFAYVPEAQYTVSYESGQGAQSATHPLKFTTPSRLPYMQWSDATVVGTAPNGCGFSYNWDYQLYIGTDAQAGGQVTGMVVLTLDQPTCGGKCFCGYKVTTRPASR